MNFFIYRLSKSFQTLPFEDRKIFLNFNLFLKISILLFTFMMIVTQPHNWSIKIHVKIYQSWSNQPSFNKSENTFLSSFICENSLSC